MRFGFSISVLSLLQAVLYVLVFSVTELHASPVIIEDQSCINITGDVSYLEDPDGTLTIDDVHSAALTNSFLEADDEITSLNLGYTTSAYWIRFRLASLSGMPQERFLEVAYFGLDKLELYSPDGTMKVSGHEIDPENRLWPHRYFIFPLQLRPQEDQGYYYLKVYSTDSLILPLVLWQPKTFIGHAWLDNVLQGIYFGALISLVIYNLLMYGALQEKTYLYYAAFISSIGVGFFFFNGFGNQLLLPALVRQYSTKSAFALASFFAFLFVMELLGTKQNYPVIHRLVKPVIAVHLLTAIAPFVGISPQFAGVMLSSALVPTVMFALLLAVLSFRKKQPGSRYFLFAWTLFLFSALVTSLNNFAVIPAHQKTMNFLQYTSMFDMLLLTLSISQRVEAERKAKDDALAKAARLKENLISTLQVTGRQLEAKVRSRTKDLEDALLLEQGTFERYRKFDAMMTHDFRTPLAIIANQSQLALKELERGIDNSLHNMAVVRQAAARLNTLYTRMEEKDKDLAQIRYQERVQLDLFSWLREIGDEMSPGSGHTISVDSGSVPVIVEANAFLLRIAVTNLIDNAEKYSPPGSTVSLMLKHDDNYAYIRVGSEGKAIADIHREKIFEKHYRIHSNPDAPGRGIGLFIIRDIVESHQGSIALEATGEYGNIFCISLPLAQEPTGKTSCEA